MLIVVNYSPAMFTRGGVDNSWIKQSSVKHFLSFSPLLFLSLVHFTQSVQGGESYAFIPLCILYKTSEWGMRVLLFCL